MAKCRDCHYLVNTLVDTYHIDEQAQLVNLCVTIANSIGLPIIIAIRTSNLARLLKTGAYGDCVYISDIGVLQGKLFDKLERIPSFGMEPLLALMQKRLDFLQKYDKWDLFVNLHQNLNVTLGMNFLDFWENFKLRFREISNTVVANGINENCNHSIRNVLLSYARFLSKIIIDPEVGFKEIDLVPSTRTINITKLRTYYYKWVICDGQVRPTNNYTLAYIHPNGTPLKYLYIDVLAYLHSHTNRSINGGGILYSDLLSLFTKLRVDKDVFDNALYQLCVLSCQGVYTQAALSVLRNRSAGVQPFSL